MFSVQQNIENKVVVITGGSSGLGEQMAYEAAKRKAIVVVCARREEMLQSVKERCEEFSGKPTFSFKIDVSSPESIEEVYELILEKVGKIDILVNNAGFGLFRKFVEFDMGCAEKMFRVNVLGMMYLTQKVAIHMAERGKGHIVNIASQGGKMATPKSSIYSATKFAVIGFSNALRLELKPLGISVTTVNPGPIETDFFKVADETGDYLASVNWFLLQPQPLAERIVNAFETNRREINAPFILELANKAYTLFPTLGDYIAGNVFDNK